MRQTQLRDPFHSFQNDTIGQVGVSYSMVSLHRQCMSQVSLHRQCMSQERNTEVIVVITLRTSVCHSIKDQGSPPDASKFTCTLE